MLLRSILISFAILYAVISFAGETTPLITGQKITPLGKETNVGSFPSAMAFSPDGKFVVVSNTGFRQYLTVLSSKDGSIVDQADFNKSRPAEGGGTPAIYLGLAFGKPIQGETPLYVSRGYEGKISTYNLSKDGKLTDTKHFLTLPSTAKSKAQAAGISLSGDATSLFVTDNRALKEKGLQGALHQIDIRSGNILTSYQTPGYPLAVAAITTGPLANKRVYVTSERDGVVSSLIPGSAEPEKRIMVGDNPVALLLDRSQNRLYVANAGSDTISIVDTQSDTVVDTLILRPEDARGLPGATPLGMALSIDEKRLYVVLADMNAVAVTDLVRRQVIGYIPVGWYPTAVQISPDGKTLFVANSRGSKLRNPNSKPTGPRGIWGKYIPNIIEGTVSRFTIPSDSQLRRLTVKVITNNLITSLAANTPKIPAIEHIFYIIKENRTYDQVLGDLPNGNGDKSLSMFPREVTPNQHALAERFVLLDNFYCCAEVSADGWEWSVSGMESEYAHRNTPTNYSGRGGSYDSEGENGGLAVDLLDVPDVSRPPGGYIWDKCAEKGITFRNYGFYVTNQADQYEGNKGKVAWKFNTGSKKALVNTTDDHFLQFDMSYADSDAWVLYQCPSPEQKKTYGDFKSTSRFAEWKREFDTYVKNGNLPRLSMIRLPRDHTAGTSKNASSPRAMVADNDYAVGRIVEEISKSPYWKQSVICILEDDAQNGFDHVDAHRSTCFVISPFVRRATVDHRFYNTDSLLRTMELFLGIPPLCRYDAAAAPLDIFAQSSENSDPYEALLPAKAIIAEVNGKTAYRSGDSDKLNFTVADAAPEDDLNDILWYSIMGNRPRPAIRHAMRVGK